MSGSRVPRLGIPADWRVPVAVAVVALAFAAYTGWQAKDLDTGPGSVQLGRGLFTLIAAAGIALALGVASFVASRGWRGLARAIVLSVVALVVGYYVAYTIAPAARIYGSGGDAPAAFLEAQPT